MNGTKLAIKPFEIKVYDSDYSMAYSKIFKLTEKELCIVFHGDLVGEKDSVIFKKELSTSDTLLQLSNIDIRNLKEHYENPCIEDGSQIYVSVKMDSVIKNVQLSNYYEENIGKAIELVNSLTPKEHTIWYDKKILLAQMEQCGHDTIE